MKLFLMYLINTKKCLKIMPNSQKMKKIKNSRYSNAQNFQNYQYHNLVNREEVEVALEEDVMDMVVVAEEMDLEEEEAAAVAASVLTEMEEDKEATVLVGKVTGDLTVI
jgi:ribosomal protein L18E